MAESHRELFPAHADSYGPNVRTKLERCNELTDAEYEAARRRRHEYRERAAAAMEGIDLLLTPTLCLRGPARV